MKYRLVGWSMVIGSMIAGIGYGYKRYVQWVQTDMIQIPERIEPTVADSPQAEQMQRLFELCGCPYQEDIANGARMEREQFDRLIRCCEHAR